MRGVPGYLAQRQKDWGASVDQRSFNPARQKYWASVFLTVLAGERVSIVIDLRALGDRTGCTVTNDGETPFTPLLQPKKKVTTRPLAR